MKKYTLLILCLVSCLLLTACSGNEREKSGTSSSRRRTNYLSAVIDGERYDFQFEEAKIRYGNTIQADYSAYDARGDKAYSMSIYLDKNIKPGRYNSDTDEAYKNNRNANTGGNIQNVKMAIYLFRWSGKISGFYTNIASRPGSYSLNLTYRSDDWMRYEGSFSATVKNKGTLEIDIENGSFGFTIT